MTTPTQVAHPWRASLRTAFQVGIPALVTLGLVVPQIIDIVLESFGESLPAEVRLWLVGAAAGVTAGALALTRIMAIPAVNAWLERIGAGAKPAD